VVRPGTEAAQEAEGLLEALREGVWHREGEREALSGVLRSDVSLALCRSYHFGYDLDGVVAMPAGRLRPGQWVDIEFKAVTAFDAWAAEC
jgi:hypothetical protein